MSTDWQRLAADNTFRDGLKARPPGQEPDTPSTGRYRLLEVLGAGSCGTAWAAHDPLLDRPVAVKLLHDHLSENDRRLALERFRVELRVLGRVNHPHVVGVYDACLEGDRPYLVMELCSGPTLEAWRARTGRVPPGQAALIFHQAALALDHIHSLGIVHRDIKPANFLFHHRVLKLTDFGVARAAFSPEAEEALVGTPPYLAPEQLAGEEASPRSDLFSLAVVLYELLCGRTPFTGDITSVLHQRVYDHIPAISSEAPDLPPDFDDFFIRALARDPDARFQSGAEMGAALAHIVPEHELELLEGAGGPGQGRSLAPPTAYGYGQAPRAKTSYFPSMPLREPPPPSVPHRERISGAVPAPWLRPKVTSPLEADVMTFDGLMTGPAPKRTAPTTSASAPVRSPHERGQAAEELDRAGTLEAARAGRAAPSRRIRQAWLLAAAAGVVLAFLMWDRAGSSSATSALIPREAASGPAASGPSATVIDLSISPLPPGARLEAAVVGAPGRQISVTPAGREGRYRLEVAPALP